MLVPQYLPIRRTVVRPIRGRILDFARGLAETTGEMFFLDSARDPGRYSYLGGAPTIRLEGRRVGGSSCRVEVSWEGGGTEALLDPTEALRQVFRTRRSGEEEHPYFLSGAVGYFGYEAGHFWETFGPGRRPSLGLPDVRFGFHDTLLVADHITQGLFLASTGWGRSEEEAELDARRKADVFHATLREVESSPLASSPVSFQSDLEREPYEAAVEAIRKHIAAGDAFEVCLTTQHHVPWCFGARGFSVYERLRALSPAPYAAYLKFGGAEILSASPERFVAVDLQGRAESRPIKGTRPRGADVAEDHTLEKDLSRSEKDRAENVMIVDLVRNDFGRVCTPGSVAVPELFRVEAHPTVFQLVSTIEGRLRADADVLDLVRACFPGGSMTGAPKVEAMRIIESLEPSERGVYSGALGYIDDRGLASLSIVIRTLVRVHDSVHFGTGGAVVTDSSASGEHDEAMVKARALLTALAGGPVPVRRESTFVPRVAVTRKPIEGPLVRVPEARVMIIDHYDSFTYNLAQAVAALTGVWPQVVRHDAVGLGEVRAFAPTHVILSPGPGRGDDPARVGVSFDILRSLDVPVLGVCLGHQAIGFAFGGRVVAAPKPRHGKTSRVWHSGTGLFRGLPNPLMAMRYHSLVVEPEALPACLVPTAMSDDGVLMGLAHIEKPIYGVQFHPESIGTPDGIRLLTHFLEGRC